MQQFKERTQTNVICDGCRNRVAFSSGRGRNLAAANSYSGSGADRGDDREKIRDVSQPAEVLVGTEKNIVEEQTESAKSTETISEPMQLIPIEEVPAGAVKKAEEAAPSTQPAEEKEKPVAVENTQNYYVVQQGIR